MSQRSRFFDSSEGDRVYTSDAWAQVLGALMGTGVVATLGDELEVHESSPAAMSVRVKLGTAFVLGYFFEVYSGEETLNIAAANAVNPRIDRVVVRRSMANREVTLAVLTGTPAASPVPPDLTQTEGGTYEISLAQVLVPALSTSVIDSRITDERGSRAVGPDLGGVMDGTDGHTHDGSSGQGAVIPWANISGKPSTFTPATHASSHGSGGADPVTIPWTSVSGKPSTFTPATHTHADGSQGGTVAYSAITGKPSTFAPTAHASDHYTGGADPISVANLDGWRRLAAGGTAGTKIYVGTSTPSGPSEGDIWVKG